MNIFALCGASLVCLASILVLRQVHPSFSFVIAAFAACLFVPAAIGYLKDTVGYFSSLMNEQGYGRYIGILLKAVGIGVLAGTVANLCRDCGEASLGAKLELCARCAIIALSLPVVKDLLDQALSLL